MTKPERAREEPKAPVTEEDLFRVSNMIERYKKAAGRKNGVLLKAVAEVKKDTKGQDVILVQWSVDYAGPRFPLHILKPSLELGAYNHTAVVFYPVDKNGLAKYGVPIHPPVSTILPAYPEEAFLKVNKGEVARGALEIPLGAVANTARTKHPKVFSEFAPHALYVQLHHAPRERGEHLGLDAWTGALQSELVHVPLEKPEEK